MTNRLTPPSVPITGDGDELNASLLERYWRGETSLEETAAIDAWLSARPVMRVQYDRLLQGLTTRDRLAVSSANVDRMIASVVTAIASQSGPARPLATSSLPRTMRTSLGRIATALAAATVVVGGGWLAMTRRYSESAIAYTAYRTTSGQIARLTLADGSHVMLAPNSQLGVAVDFARHRYVTLTGEAHFDVTSRAESPFLVRTGAITTRVLGTVFDVQHYVTDSAIRVVVTSGKVAVDGPRPGQEVVTLTAGMMGVVHDSIATVVTGDQVPYVGWVDGQLVFHKTPTADVLATLTRWYGYQFHLEDTSLASRKITLGMSTESSAAALATLKQVLDVEFTFHQNVITVHAVRQTRSPLPLRRDRQDGLSTTHIEVGR